MIPADRCNFCELDRINRRLISDVYSSGERLEDDPGSEGQEVYWRLRHQHPTCAYQDRTGDFSARKISDFLSRRHYHRLALYADWYRQWGIEYWLNAGLPAPPTHTKVFIFVRRRHDFSERDREVLDLLLPHLGHLYEAAQARTVAAALAAGLDPPGELVLLDAADRIAYATDRPPGCSATTPVTDAAHSYRKRSSTGCGTIAAASTAPRCLPPPGRCRSRAIGRGWSSPA